MYLAEGQSFKARDGALWVVTSVVPKVDQVTLRTTQGFTRTESVADFQRQIVDGHYHELSGSDADKPTAGPLASQLTERQQAGLAARKPVIDFLRAKQREAWSWPEIENELQRRQACFGQPRGRRTLQRWLAQARLGDYAPGKPGWQKGRRRVADALFGAVEAVLAWARRNAVRERFNLETMRRLVVEELSRRLGLPEDGAPAHVSRSALKEVLATRAAWGDNLKQDLSPRAYRSITRTASKIMDATRPLELVEVDALIPEFHVYDAKGNDLGQPTIYCAVDVATGHVVGIRAYGMSPGVEPLLDFLAHMLFPKPTRPDGSEAPWGRPERILSDLGSEFRSAFLAVLLHEVGIDHLFAEGEAGWKKPHVERFNGTLKTELLHRLPGSTKSSVTRKVDPSLAAGRPGLTLRELNAALERYAFDVHAHRTSDRLRLKFADPEMTPAKAWARLSKDYPPMLPISREDFRQRSVEPVGQVELTHAGVRIWHLEYSSDELVSLYREIGPSRVELYGSPLDVGLIYICHRESGKGATALAKNAAAHGVPRRIWSEITKKLSLGKNTLSDAKADRLLARLIRDATETASAKPMKEKKKARAAAQSMALAEQWRQKSVDDSDKDVSAGDGVMPQTARRTTIRAFNPKASDQHAQRS